jgi:integrase/recombinase XerD
MQQKHEQDMKTMREEMNQQFNQIMAMIQHNPVLAQVKPGSLGGISCQQCSKRS